MIKAPAEDLELGLEVYSTSTKPIKGLIKERLEDFIVEEVLDCELLKDLSYKWSFRHQYPLFRVVKRGEDTLSLISRIAAKLNVEVGKIRFLGLKDSKSISIQYISIAERRVWRNDELTLVGWLKKPLSRGSLLGNKFKIKVKVFEKVDLRRFAEEVAEKGLPNFYGYQRFGSPRRITHRVGEKLVKSDLKGAVLTYLTATSGCEREEVRKWRKELRDSLNFKVALKEAPKGLKYELLMIKSLIGGEGYEKALNSLPISLRRLFVNSYQSYLFNKTLSLRIINGLPINRALKGEYFFDYRDKCFKKNAFSEGKRLLALPIIGYGYKPSKGIQGKLERKVMEECEIKPKMFYLKNFPELSAKTSLRLAEIDFKYLILERVGESVLMNFLISPGSYATIVLREFIKPRKPCNQGF